MTFDDIKIGQLIQNKERTKKYKIIDMINDTVIFKSIIYGANETRQIKIDKLLKNFIRIFVSYITFYK